MADILQIGISGLRASQSALTVTGHNITNANTEGYSRQVLSQSTTSPQAQGGVWVGTGVSVDAVSRIYDKFLTEQLWRDSSTFNKFETLANNAEQINSLLADANTGIQPGLEKMFGALQTVADSPASLAARAVLLSESQGLVDRFHLISDRLSSQNTVVNGQLKVIAGEITEKAKAIAQLNEQIAFASASAQGNKPNDLLDRRDQLVKDLSELVDLKVVEQDDGIWNITIGNGQPLVVGIESRTLKAASGSSDATRLDLFFETERGDQQVTGSISGGKLGGILDFRNQVLEPTYNELGRLALVINQTFNEQHKLGIDYDGRQGVDYFTDINEPVKTYGRVLSDGGNKQPQDRVVSVYINDASVLTTSDYRVEFPGPDDFSYRIVRASDNQLMLTSSLNGVFPNSIEVDGFEIRFEAGTFQSGDKFLITPTRNGAAELELNITRGEQIAMASPIKSDATLGNRGNAKITQPTVYNSGTQFFSEQGELKPPLIVVFTSPTTYDVLDNSDPGRPVPLFPPITNQ
ncbi:MAG: flagellar hook-associated protein FlgK, partial [Venatoribacter sp.]